VLAGLPGKGEEQADVKIRVLNCSGNDKQEKIELNRGFYAGLQISRAPDVLVRGNWLTGGAYEFEDCGELMFDGNTLVSARHISVRQTKSGGFKRTTITKCDFYDVQLRLEAPTADTPDKVVIDKCWFSGIEDPEEILAHAVKDGTTDQSSGARAHFRKINKRPLCIGGEPVH
jgi:hypothetical protein